MQVILKNITDDDIELSDLSGITIQDQSQKDISDIPLYLLGTSNVLLQEIASGSLIVNNGTQDLSASDGIRYVSLQKHINPISPDGKETIKAESRPPGHQTNFTGIGDGVSIHDGQEMFWDFSNDDYLVTDTTSLYLPIPDGFKRKRLKVSFNDPVYIKEGAIYFVDAQKGSYVDMSVVCPKGQYYLDRDGVPILADTDVYLSNYVSHHFIYGTCNLGDEMNAETCQEVPIPTNYEVWMEITVPDDDTVCFGWGNIELYRTRTAFYPGETV